MSPKKFFLVISCVMMLTLASVTPLLAQENFPRVICDELSADDCLLLQRSQQEMRLVTTAHTTGETLFQLVDMPIVTMDGEQIDIPELAVEIMVDNAYTFDEATAEQWRALAGIDQNVMTLAAMVAPESILQLFAGLTAETQIRVRLSDAVYTWLTEESGQPVPAEINLTMRIVDNILYLDLLEIAAALNAGDPPAAWGMIDLAELWQVPAQNSESVSPATVAAFMVGFAVARNNEQLVTYYEDLQRLRALDRQLAPGRIIQVERGEDQTLNGIGVASYTTTVDVRRMATWLAGLVQKFLATMEQEVGPEVTVALTMGPSFLTGVESTNTAYIEPATARVHRQENTLIWDFSSLLGMASLFAGQTGNAFQVESEPGAQPQLILQTETDFDYATQVNVEAPEDVVAVPLDEVFVQE